MWSRLDYGLKTNILRCLANAGCKVTVLPATAKAEDVLARAILMACSCRTALATRPKPASTRCRNQEDRGQRQTGVRYMPRSSDARHRAGGKTKKAHQGHHGANHPVKDFTTEKVEIVSMNHGFAVATACRRASRKPTSLFDGSNCGLQLDGKPVFSVQHHPEASPGPQDSHYLFTRLPFYAVKRGRKK